MIAIRTIVDPKLRAEMTGHGEAKNAKPPTSAGIGRPISRRLQGKDTAGRLPALGQEPGISPIGLALAGALRRATEGSGNKSGM